jgi:hypothetical protein
VINVAGEPTAWTAIITTHTGAAGLRGTLASFIALIQRGPTIPECINGFTDERCP